MIALKTAIVLLCAWVGAASMRRRSASLRHAVLATGFVMACLLPGLERAAPGWGVSAVSGLGGLSSESTDVQVVRALWYGGAASGLFTIVLGLARIAWLRASARPVDARLQWIADDAATEFGIQRVVTVLETDLVTMPMTWGLVHPKILIPAAAHLWSDDCLRAVLRHELAHVRRGDWAVQLVAALLTRVFWFNPVAWLAASQLRLESERACDDAVLNLGMNGAEYAVHLVHVARSMKRGGALARVAPSAGGSGGFGRRIAAVLDPSIQRAPVSTCACAAVVLVLVAAAIPVAGFGQPASHETPSLLGVQRDVLRRFGGEERSFSIVADDISFWRNRIQGRVELQARLNVDGSLSAVRVLEPVHPDLASAAEVIVRHWRREPALVRGVPVEVPIRMTVDFRR